MSEKKEDRKLLGLSVDIAENGYELRCSYEPKKTLSQKKGWVPCSYEEPKKYVARTKKELLEQIDKVL
jgi:hypothetical protein